MNTSPKEPNTNSNSPTIPGTGNDHRTTKERTSELPASATNKNNPGNDLLPPVIPQRAVDDGGVKSTNASASPQQSGERMLGLQKSMATTTADRASAHPQGGLEINAMATATTLPQSEKQMREEILLLQEQQRLVEQEILQQRLLIAEQRQREGLELLALHGIGPSATTTTTAGINIYLLRTPEALQRELLKVEAEESRLKQMQRQLQQQQLAAQGGISPSILELEKELAMAEQAHAAEMMLRVRAERALQMQQAHVPTGHQSHQVVAPPPTATASSSTTTLPDSNPIKATTATKTKTSKRASSAATKNSTKEGTKKKRKVGRPIGSSAKAKERSKQLADASRLFQTESFLLGMAEVGPSDDFTMSPEMAASILGASTTTHAGLNVAMM